MSVPSRSSFTRSSRREEAAPSLIQDVRLVISAATSACRSTQNWTDHFTVITIEALPSWDLEMPRIQTQEMIDRGMHVGHIMRVLLSVESNFVGGPMDDSTLDSTPGHPDAEPVRMMIPSIPALRAWSAPKLGRKNDESVIQQTARF